MPWQLVCQRIHFALKITESGNSDLEHIDFEYSGQWPCRLR